MISVNAGSVTPEEVAERTAGIKASWDEATRQKRRVMPEAVPVSLEPVQVVMG